LHVAFFVKEMPNHAFIIVLDGLVDEVPVFVLEFDRPRFLFQRVQIADLFLTLCPGRQEAVIEDRADNGRRRRFSLSAS
jgi:hypothetical protein